MEEDNLQQKRNVKIQPREKSSIISRLCFCWALPLFYRRYKREVLEEECYTPLKSHDSCRLGDKLEDAWNHEFTTNTNNASLWRALWKTFHLEFLAFGSVFVFSEFALKMTQPWLIGQVLNQYTTKSKIQLYIYGSLLLLNCFLSMMIGHTYILKIQHLGMKVRVACCSLIYRKLLKLDNTTLAETTAGRIVNLVTNDVNRFDFAPMFLLQLFVAPFETILAISCLYVTAGWSVIAGISFLLLFVPCQMWMGKLTSKYRSKTAVETDQRVKLMNEIVAGIQAIKLYTWEKFFTQMVKKVRKIEICQITKISYLKAFNVSCMLFMNRTGISLCILTYAITRGKVDATQVFVISSFFAVLRQTLTVYFPFSINSFAETKVSVNRIREFLISKEIQEQSEKHIITFVTAHSQDKPLIKDSDIVYKITNTTSNSVHMKNVSAKWCFSSRHFTIHNINFAASSNELVAIIGPVGSGKSTLLHAILREIPYSKEFIVEGTISYASQKAWLFSGTIRKNILFGSPFNIEKYNRIIRICGLQEDLAGFPDGDNSLVGESGALLSGGQKSRINLARAIYKDADIYLLDDPFAAVDAKVGRHIFQECILEYLKQKCIVLVTHQLHYLSKATKIYKMDKGKLSLVENNKVTISNKETPNDLKTNMNKLFVNVSKKTKKIKEERKSGKISKEVYRNYRKAGGNFFAVLILSLLFILAQAAASGADYFLAFWTNLEQYPEERRFFSHEICIYIYSTIIICTITISLIRSMSFFKFCMNASRNLHKNMFVKVITAPMGFFNVNSSGIILNRFSKDIGLVDETLPTTLMDTFQIALIVLGSVVLLVYLNPWMAIPTVIMLIIFYFYKIVYLATSLNLKRLEAINRSPVYAHINASLEGLSTIRCHKAQKILKNEFDKHQNRHTSAFYMFLTCNKAFGFWLDMTCVCYTIIVVVTILLTDNSVGNIGLGITQSMNLIGLLQFGIKQWSELENQMISVERVVDYAKITPEVTISNKPPLEMWPREGEIKFEKVCVDYSDKKILKQISFTIKPEEKIGIVGRTGAGKTSLITALFRLSHIKGTIRIDGVNIAEIPLKTLRSKMSIIPQEPTLFTGSLRDNLDPFQEYNDDSLWQVLEQVEMKNTVLQLPSQLSSDIVKSGTNFSVGQRQLISLARAILKKNKILILDEATANIDLQTDNLIQKTIKTNFHKCTVLTIAHRLHSVMNSDRVLVMDGGEVVEYDHAYLLLQDPRSMFSQFVHESGDKTVLLDFAKQDYEQRRMR